MFIYKYLYMDIMDMAKTNFWCTTQSKIWM